MEIQRRFRHTYRLFPTTSTTTTTTTSSTRPTGRGSRIFRGEQSDPGCYEVLGCRGTKRLPASLQHEEVPQDADVGWRRRRRRQRGEAKLNVPLQRTVPLGRTRPHLPSGAPAPITTTTRQHPTPGKGDQGGHRVSVCGGLRLWVAVSGWEGVWARIWVGVCVCLWTRVSVDVCVSAWVCVRTLMCVSWRCDCLSGRVSV